MFSPFFSSHQGVALSVILFPPFQRISIDKAGGDVSYSSQMFLLSHDVSRCCIQAAQCCSWQELTQKSLHYTFRWRWVLVVCVDFGSVFFVFFFLKLFRSIMCGNFIAWNDLDIFCYSKTIWHLLSWATTETPCCSEVCLEFLFRCHKAISVCFCHWAASPERSNIYYSHRVSVHNMWDAGQMHYKETVAAVKSLQPKQRKQEIFKGKEM